MASTTAQTGAAGERAAWKTRLQPWLDALKQAQLAVKIPRVVRPTVSDIDDLWLEVEMEADAVNQRKNSLWIMLVEAMEILELLARVDLALAWRLLTEYSTSCEEWVKAQSEGIQVLPRFQLTVYADPELSCVEATFKGLATLGGDGAAHSATYSDVNSALLANWMEVHHDGQAFDRQRDGYVEVAVHFGLANHWDAAEGAFDRLLEKIKRISLAPRRGAAIATQSPGTARASCPFSIDVAKYQCDAYQPALSARLLSMVSISSMQIPLTGMNMKFFESNKLHETVWSDFVEKHVASTEGAGLSRLAFGLDRNTVADVETFCMAIAHSSSLREVEFGCPKYAGTAGFSDIFTQSKWLAYAIFSGEASHAIHTVKIDMFALEGTASVDAMRTVLSHTDPLALLYQSNRSEDTPVVDVRPSASAAVVSPSATLHRGHYSGPRAKRDGKAVKIEPGIAYRVLRNRQEENIVEILVPHGCVCWVKRSDVLEMRPVMNRETHPVRHLRLKNMVQGGVAPGIELIALVGGPLERLTIEEISTDEEEMTLLFDTIARCCPHLKCLEIADGWIDTLDLLCKKLTQLERLRLVEVVAHKSDSWDNFMSALGDPTHALTQSLQELHISFSPYNERLQTTSIKNACVAMLETNQRLRRCELVNCEEADTASWGPRFRAHDGELLPVRLKPLPQAETLAFLSVVTAHQSGSNSTKRSKPAHSSQPAQHQLSVDVLSRILELAALPVRRVCIMAKRY